MQEAIIIHGGPRKEKYYNPDLPTLPNANWLPWLQKQFQMVDILAQTPSMPRPYDPTYAEWEEMLNRFVSSNLAYAVGHSSGGGFLVKYLQTHKLPLKKLILVAPWFDFEKRWGEEWLTDFDPNALDGIEVHMLISDDDTPDQQQSARVLMEAYPSIIEHRYKDKGHFVGIPTIPEVWEIIQNG